ncbi:hypothetical protein EVAR_97206_1 [Eumeta japonica]|uniref:Uncharacterized protein n=1 Tax=Eumeta variegata TaxID=151549 RepID=A0A4C1WJ94_EUMVA|nr:hypothetical protein EVAR_97206_1 [Eumeta japonica]
MLKPNNANRSVRTAFRLAGRQKAVGSGCFGRAISTDIRLVPRGHAELCRPEQMHSRPDRILVLKTDSLNGTSTGRRRVGLAVGTSIADVVHFRVVRAGPTRPSGKRGTIIVLRSSRQWRDVHRSFLFRCPTAAHSLTPFT